jgi:fatty acid desaturase
MEPTTTEPTTELLRDAIAETRELVRIEVALAKDEARRELQAVERAAIAFGVAGVAAILALATWIAVVVVAIGWLGGLILGGIFAVVAAGMALVGMRMVPKAPLQETRERLEKDVHRLKERMA